MSWVSLRALEFLLPSCEWFRMLNVTSDELCVSCGGGGGDEDMGMVSWVSSRGFDRLGTICDCP